MLIPLLAGCHLVLPLDGAGDTSPGDGPAADASRDAGPPADGPMSVGERGDLPQRDATPDVLAVLDTGPDASISALCQGISLYLPFDGTKLNGLDGTGAPVSSTIQTTGGGGVSVQSTGLIGEGGQFTGFGELRFPASLYDATAGTVALWVRITYAGFPPAYTLYFQRAHFAAGPEMVHDQSGQSLGVRNYNADGGMTQVTADDSQIATYWSASWNHLVSTWSQSGPERLTFTLNGDPAGGSPTRLTTGASWTPATPTAFAFSVGGSSDNTSAASYMVDEVALWSRPLSLAEIKLLHALQSQGSKSIGQLCGLP